MKESIDKAINWWANKISKRVVHINGDDSTTSVMAYILTVMEYKKVTDDQLEIFRNELRNQIEEYRKEFKGMDIWLGCDYGPCKHLGEAAKKAGINDLNFPFKTKLVIENDGKVLVSDEYGMRYV